jgi:hypothetical protein
MFLSISKFLNNAVVKYYYCVVNIIYRTVFNQDIISGDWIISLFSVGTYSVLPRLVLINRKMF